MKAKDRQAGKNRQVAILVDVYTLLGPIAMGDSYWTGANAVILPGVNLGNRCMVGAGSVVTKSVPDDNVIARNPAKRLLLPNR